LLGAVHAELGVADGEPGRELLDGACHVTPLRRWPHPVDVSSLRHSATQQGEKPSRRSGRRRWLSDRPHPVEDAEGWDDAPAERRGDRVTRAVADGDPRGEQRCCHPCFRIPRSPTTTGDPPSSGPRYSQRSADRARPSAWATPRVARISSL
jgi:hypothetical protein